MSWYPAGIPRRKCIQEYITDPARTNPLLGKACSHTAMVKDKFWNWMQFSIP